MTARDTSVEAYRSIAPKLSERQAAVMALLERSHALTNSEIARELGWTINRVTPRTNELVGYGLVHDYGKRRCRVTQRMAHIWGVSALKQKPPPKFVPMEVMIDGVRRVRFVPQV